MTKEDLEQFYKQEDPWDYQTTEDDQKRKDIILSYLKPAKRALDIGCGEGWITKDLPAKEIHGIELSDNAASRFPENVIRVSEPEGDYDLITAMGVMYKEYDNDLFHKWILDHASGLVLTCNIKGLEINYLPDPITEFEFPYREYIEVLRIYDFAPTTPNRKPTAPKPKPKKSVRKPKSA